MMARSIGPTTGPHYERDGRFEGGMAVMEIDISSYVLPFNWNLMKRDEDDEASSKGSANMELTRKKMCYIACSC